MKYFLLMLALLIVIYGIKKVIMFIFVAGAIIIGLPVFVLTAVILYLVFNKKVKFYKYTNYNFNQNGRGENYKWDERFANGKYQEDISLYYKELGVAEESSDEEIKKAHRNMVKKHHPDIYAHRGEEERKASEIKLKKINEAYEKIKKYRENNVK